MIYEVEGDIMLTRAEVIAHGVSTNDAMTRGMARKLRERFPLMTTEFQAWCQKTSAEPGQIWFWGEPDKTRIINMITHAGDDDATRTGRPEKIAVNRTLREINRLYTVQRFKSLAMPTVGAGESGLDWSEVRDMLQAQLGDLLIPIFVYVKELDGQIAHEPGL